MAREKKPVHKVQRQMEKETLSTKKWSMPIRNWGQVYGELSIMYEGRLPE